MSNATFAVLLSGSGSTFENLCSKHDAGVLSARPVAVVSSRANVLGVERAQRRNIPAFVVERKKIPDVVSFSRQVFAALEPYEPDWIVLGGFMSLLQIPERYHGRVINIHPSLLPAFSGKGMYGHHVHEAVLKYGSKITGCTVHFVNEHYDEGAIIAQQPVPVLDNDTVETLAERVQAAERELYPQVLQWLADGRVTITGRHVCVSPNAAHG